MPAMVGYLNHWATASRNSSRQWVRCSPVVIRSFEHLPIGFLAQFHSNFEEEHTCVVRCLPLLISFHQPLERTAARRLFRVHPCRKGKIHVQTSMHSPGFEPSPYGAVVSFANHYTEWATP
ncbi:hypothetical protein TNCV_2393471 [Trichonephila clavipes]|nr:hypothetical protein TNCV_2393471 [Trichonephila clavipes]